MPRHKRRFETLEDRRLLAALVGPMTPAESLGSAGGAPVSTATPNTATPNTATPNTAASANQSSADGDAAEYASSAPSSGSSTPASSYDYGSSSDNGSSYYYPTNSTDPYSSSKTTSNSHPTTQPTPTSTSLASEGATAGQINVSSAGLLAFTVPALGPSPSASASPPAARSPAGPLVWEQEAEDAATTARGPGSLNESELMAPVALTSSEADFDLVRQRAQQVEELMARAEQVAPAAEIRTGAPIAGSPSVNFATIEQGIDEVFDRIERLGDDLVGRAGATRIAEWVVIAGGACAAFEYVRIRLREGAPWQTAGPWPVPYEPRLRRRWFGRRSGR